MCVKMNMENNQFNTNNAQCDSSIDASCGSDQSEKFDKKTGAGMKQAQATQEHITGYVNSLIVSSVAPYIKVSEVNLGNHMQVFYAAAQGINDKQLIAAADMAYDVIDKKLTASIKTHMNYIETSFANKRCYYKDNEGKCLGDLKFNNPSIYLKSLQESHSDSARMISPSDKTLSYKFFMIRAVIGEYARSLEPDWVVTFKENSDKSYTGNDVLDSFEYISAKSEKMTGHNGLKINREAGKILKTDKLEVDKIVHNVFDEFITDCNKLKITTSLHHQVTVCQNVNEVGDPDYFLELLTCLEIFNLATTAGFCKELEYEESFDF
jgi:hypothetical protein